METKAQRAERLKLEKNPWKCFEEIEGFARQGWDAIPPEWLSTYFRWWGIYTQGDGRGLPGGSGGEGKVEPYFMVRVRVTNGLLASHQLRTLARICEKYGRGMADITVRQNFQLHWVNLEALPELMRELWGAGLTTMGACGDDTRNITGCSLAGIDAEEICDASPLALEASSVLVGDSRFYNLPRKFKICITGCRSWCAYPEINDIGITAIERMRKAEREIGFSLRIGGGLSSDPHLAVRLNAFLRWEQVVPSIQGIAEIFRDASVLRENRARARLKYLFKHCGWTPERFQAELEERTGFRFEPAEPEQGPADVYRDHVGIHPQKQGGLCYVGACVQRGRITSAQMHAAADLSERMGGGELRTTTMQNLIFIHVPHGNADILARELTSIGLPVAASPFWRGTVACTGTEFCKLAITETKAFSRWLIEEMEERLPEFDQDLKLNVTGCPNGCGQHWIADIGIEGKKIRENGTMADAYSFCLGGAVGAHQALARPVGYRCAASDVPDAIERLLREYLLRRATGENLRQFFARHEEHELRAFLAGKELAAVVRDTATAEAPRGVEG